MQSLWKKEGSDDQGENKLQNKKTLGKLNKIKTWFYNEIHKINNI